MLNTLVPKEANLSLAGEAKTGSDGDQPALSNLSEWNSRWGQSCSSFTSMSISGENTLQNATACWKNTPDCQVIS